MRHFLILLILLAYALECFPQKKSSQTGQPGCNSYVYERFRNYLDNNEETATQVTNQVGDLGKWESKTQVIRIGTYSVEWIDEVTKTAARSSVRINGELITLWDKSTVNAPDDSGKFTLDVIGQWDQIKLYELYDQSIIAISMLPRMCTGLMCGVSAQLWYDVKSRQKTFFGEFRTESDVRLFRYPREDAFYVLGTNFRGDPHGATSPIVVRYEFYKLQSDGNLALQKDAFGKAYFVEHTMFPDTVLLKNGETKHVNPPPDTLTQNWVENVLTTYQ